MSRFGICCRCLVNNSRIIACEINKLDFQVCDECYVKSSEGLVRYFEVPSDNLADLKSRFAKLGKRAKRLKLPEPTFTIVGEERVIKKNEITGLTEKVYLLHHITVDPGISEVKIAGWTFVATIQHTDDGNILRKVGDTHIPAKYRNVSTICEHCNTQRNRKDTYVLFNESKNEYKQVGRNCLADFFGHDALMYAERAQYLCDLSDIAEAGEDMGFGGGGGPHYDALEVYLSHVAQCIRVEGWLSRSRAREMYGAVQATADIAYEHMSRQMKPSQNFKPLYTEINQESSDLADKAIEWCSNIEGEDIADYLHNIRIIARRGVVESRDMGLGASIVAAYQRHLNDLHQKELRAKRSEIAKHVGTIGDRTIFKLYVESVITCDSAFGTSFLHIMSDAEGNVYKWFSSTTTLDANKEYLLKGTIKKHGEYKGVKENVLSRCDEVNIKTFLCIVDNVKLELSGLTESEVRKQLREKLNLKKLPKTAIIVEKKEEIEGAI